MERIEKSSQELDKEMEEKRVKKKKKAYRGANVNNIKICEDSIERRNISKRLKRAM